MVPHWLSETSMIFLIVSCVFSLVIAADIISGNRQKMMVMSFVWPITALWSGPFGLWVYWTIGRQRSSHG